MKNAIAILLSSCILSGCLYQQVSSNDIEHATKICAKAESTVVNISAQFTGNEYVTCSNRKTYRLTSFE